MEISQNSTAITPSPSATLERVRVIMEQVRPYLQSHGGDVTVVGLDADVLTLKVEGTCAHCTLVNLTYNKIVKTLLNKEVPEIQRVVLT